MAKLIQASTGGEVQIVAELFREYAAEIALDLCFQHFDDALPAGCGALRPIDEETAEMKRLYVRPQFRQRGFGRLLSERLIEDAQQIGYRRIYLDTHLSMTAARSLYARLGFVEIAPYYHNPLA